MRLPETWVQLSRAATNESVRGNHQPHGRNSHQEPKADDTEGNNPVDIVHGDVQTYADVDPKPQSKSDCYEHPDTD
jgi:hypothetical protein